MERLTRRSADGRACFKPHLYGQMNKDVCDRLAAYEETGLEPGEIEQLKGEVFGLRLGKQELEQYRALGPIDRLRELDQADREGRCVVLNDLTVADLQQMLTVLDCTRYGDGAETYTTGYRNGHRNGRIEILRHVLGINEGDSAEAEAALRREQKKEKEDEHETS